MVLGGQSNLGRESLDGLETTVVADYERKTLNTAVTLICNIRVYGGMEKVRHILSPLSLWRQ